MGNLITKKTLIIIVAIVVIGWFAMSSFNSPAGTETATSTSATAGKTVAKTTTTVKKAVVPVASQPVLTSYTKAMETYKGSLRIQLSGGDSFCQATPNNVMYKNGTSIMIDNRSAKTRTVKLLGTHTIAGYGFTILKLSSGTLPATLLMDCDTQQNVAKVLLQK